MPVPLLATSHIQQDLQLLLFLSAQKVAALTHRLLFWYDRKHWCKQQARRQFRGGKKTMCHTSLCIQKERRLRQVLAMSKLAAFFNTA